MFTAADGPQGADPQDTAIRGCSGFTGGSTWPQQETRTTTKGIPLDDATREALKKALAVLQELLGPSPDNVAAVTSVDPPIPKDAPVSVAALFIPNCTPSCRDDVTGAFHWCVDKGDLPCSRYLLETFKVTKEEVVDTLSDPLHAAVRNGDFTMLGYLQEAFALTREDITATRPNTVSPFCYACSYASNLEVVQYLVDTYDINVANSRDKLQEAIKRSVDCGAFKTTRFLVDLLDAKPKDIDSEPLSKYAPTREIFDQYLKAAASAKLGKNHADQA